MKRTIATLLSVAMLLMLLPMAMPASAATEISNIAVEVVAPQAGRNPNYAATVQTEGLLLDTEDDAYGTAQENGVIWFCGEQPVDASEQFEVGRAYTVRVELMRASDEYTISYTPTLTINGQEAYRQYGNYMYIVLEYTFPALTGYTITFNAGNGAGTMAPVSGVAGEYTLPECGFTPPYSTQEFKCWRISTDSYDWYPDETIHVYQDITVTAVWKSKDNRTKIFDVVCTAEGLENIPVLYGKKEIPDFITTQGNPAYVNASTGNLRWQRKEGDTWVTDDAGRFTPGEWRISTQVRIDSRTDPSNQSVLGDPVSLTVNGKAWIPENGTGKPFVDATYSVIFFVSPSFIIEENPNIQPPASVEQVTLRLEGYRCGSPVENAVVKGNDCIEILESGFFEADSAQDLLNDDPQKVRQAGGVFSADKAYAVMVAFTAADNYIIDDLTYENVTFENAGEIGEYKVEEVFRGVYILNPPAKCTVTFNSNGGSAVASQSVDFGERVTKPANPTKAGYTFKCWMFNGSAYDFNTMVNEDFTLDASWEKNTHTHKYAAATCYKPKTCTICGETTGSKLGHSYKAATCTKAKTCTRCGITSGSKLGHSYKAATCTRAKICTRCGITSGSKLGHSYSNACDKTCNRCSATRTIAHTYKKVITKATLTKNGKIQNKCSVCGYVSSKVTAIRRASSFKLSYTTYTYNGKAKTPSVTVKDTAGKVLKKGTDYVVTYSSGRKNVGTYKVKITFKGNYSGSKTLTFKVNPAKTTLSKLAAGTKKLTVSIAKKKTQVSGYQLQYSTSKKFTSAKTKTTTATKVTLKGLKAKKTYYVRVRTYKTVGGVKYYSGWSTYKYKKTK